MYDRGVMGQAKARLGDFVRLGNQKFICISQGGSQGTDWQEHTETARRYEWEVTCQGCGRYFEPRWSGFREDGSRWGLVYETVKTEAGDVDQEHAARTAAMECPHCRHRHSYSAATLGAWNASGRYVDAKTRELWDEKTCGDRVLFHWEAVIDYPWRDLVIEWLAAKKSQAMGDYEKLKTFIQKRCADHDNPNGKNPHALVYEFRRFDPCEQREGQGVVIASIDVQHRNYWMMVAEVSKKGGEVRRLWYGRCNEDSDVDAVLEKYRPWIAGVDVNWNKNKDNSIFRFALRRRLIGLVGDKEASFPHWLKKLSGETCQVRKIYSEVSNVDAFEGFHDAPQRDRYCPRIRFSSDAIATRVHRMIDKGLWLEPSSGEDPVERREYDKQMSAEHQEMTTDSTGRQIAKWVAHSKSNHAWDCAKMIVALATIVSDSDNAPIEFA
jgi:hypothetical protein